MLKIRSLNKSYANGAKILHVLKNIDLSIKEGHFKVKVVKEILVNYHVENVELNPRISLLDHKGLQNDIKSIEVKLEKFKDDFDQKPEILFMVLTTLMQRYILACQYSDALRVWKKAVSAVKVKYVYYKLILASLRALISLIGRITRGK